MDLEFLAVELQKWPCDSLTTVRLDADGEIVFDDGSDHDFYADDLTTARAVFSPSPRCSNTGINHTRHDWEQTRND